MALSYSGPINKNTRCVSDVNGFKIFEERRAVFDTEVTNANYMTKFSEMFSELGIAVGSQHATFTACYVVKLTPTIVSKREGVMAIEWATPGLDSGAVENIEQTSYSAATSYMQVNKDVLDNPLTVQYTYPDTQDIEDKFGAGIRGKTFNTGVVVNILKPQFTFNKIQVESADPETKELQYVGYLNTSTWEGYGALTVLCKSIRGTQRNNKWNVTYEFEYRPDGWNELIYYIDKFTGKPPSDLVADTGVKSVALYDCVSFSGILS